MGVTTEPGALFGNNSRLMGKALLLDITIVNLFVSSSMDNAAPHAGKHLATAFEWKDTKYLGSFLATYSLVPLVLLYVC